MEKKWFFSISFEGVNKKLSPSDGLSMYDLITWFEGIKKLITAEQTKHINLVAIEEGSYKAVLETDNEEVAEAMSDIHETLQNLEPLSSENQRNYVHSFKKVVDKKQLTVHIEVDNSFNAPKRSFEILPENFTPKKTDYYYEIDEIEGVVTNIGNQKSDKISIWVDGFPKKIEITNEQDLALKNHYRTSIISAMIEKKIRVDNDRVVSAILLTHKEIGNAYEEIDPEELKRCFTENSIFTVEDLEKLKRNRESYTADFSE